MLKIGVIGAGKMGLLHSAILNHNENCVISSISEPSDMILNSFKTFNSKIATYKNYEDMLSKEDLDCIYITSPTHLHSEMAIKCLEGNKHVFLEKPLAINCSEAKPVLELSQRVDRSSMVGYMMRYIETFEKTKRLIDSGNIGRIINFNAKMQVAQIFSKGRGWRSDPLKSGGGVVILQATHLIDLLCWYFGFPNKVQSNFNNYYSEKLEDFCHCNFIYDDELTGSFFSSWSIFNKRLLETSIEIHGTNGQINVNDDTLQLYVHNDADEFKAGYFKWTKPELSTGVSIDVGGTHYTRQDNFFIQAIKENLKIDHDIPNAYLVQKVTDAVYSSATTKDTVEIVN
ncbi:MAG: hypothetical protein COA79_17195 [Planctomycetota bacterium]|nr:MAG: hypothetical protein COA79_17195 [Planctomycetota bacterium]